MSKYKCPETLRRLGATIRKRRLARGLTQAQLAERVPCHHNHVSAVERGANISIVMVARFSRALGTTVKSLFRSARI